MSPIKPAPGTAGSILEKHGVMRWRELPQHILSNVDTSRCPMSLIEAVWAANRYLEER